MPNCRIDRRKLDAGDVPHDWSIAGPFSESEPCGSAGRLSADRHRLVSQVLPASEQRCRTPHPASVRRRIPMQRCVDQWPASGHAALRLHSVLCMISAHISTLAVSRTSSPFAWTTRISRICVGTRAPASIATHGSSAQVSSTSSSGAPASPLRRSLRRLPRSRSPRACAIR